MKRKVQSSIAACAFEIRQAGSEVQLFPAGTFRARDGRPQGIAAWRMSEAAARRIIAQAILRQTPYVIDYEHQTLHAEKNGQPAPRAARFNRLEWRPGAGLFAVDVDWTDRAKQYIDGDEYGYISPVFRFDSKTGEVLGLLHCALTNDPAIDGMQDVGTLAAAKFGLNETQEDHLMNKALLELLGLNADATEEEVIAACKALQLKIAEQQADLTKKDEVIAAAKSETPDPKKYVPIEAFTELQGEVAALKAGHTEREVENLLKPAIEDGRLRGDAQIAWARSLGKSDTAALKTYLETAQPVAALKGTQTGGAPPAGAGGKGGELNETELAVCKQMGVSPEEFKKSRDEQAA